LSAPGVRPTVGIYAHYDGQPVDSSNGTALHSTRWSGTSWGKSLTGKRRLTTTRSLTSMPDLLAMTKLRLPPP
jgi:hypothetical protein